jgi:4-diphosphocytidyl-2-C-methyl-D-erythritol kinase
VAGLYFIPYMNLEKRSYTRVTLALDILRKIQSGPFEGYHELAAIKHRIDLHDVITVQDASHDHLECDNAAVPCDDRNVCMKAVRLLKQTFSIDRCVKITITKQIPVMGGLAGGSANAATTFDLLNELWDLRLPVPELVRLGRHIGMDVPYYFVGATAFDSEAGERLEAVPTPCSFTFLLAVPDFGVSTRDAYQGLDYRTAGKMTCMTSDLRAALIAGDRAAVPSLMHNDFEQSVITRHPRLAGIKKQLYDAGCAAAMLTGSGSTIIGVVRDLVQAEKIGSVIDCRTIIASTHFTGDKTAIATA